LAQEGFKVPTSSNDQMYYFDSKEKSYKLLTPISYDNIFNQQIRF